MTNKELTGLMIKQLLHEWECTKSISTAYDICSTLCECYKINGNDSGKASSNDSWKLLDIYMNIVKITNQKEPLIKDEKIRKAVRAWAEACELKHVTYKQASNEFYDANTRGAFAIRFTLMPVEVYLEDGEHYTIAELCGEDEE